MRALLAVSILAGAALPAAAAAQVTARADSLHSRSLSRTMRFEVVLPDGYDSTRTYPVLWLLHGFGGDDSSWLRQSRLEHYLRSYPLLVVLPDAQLSWYVNALGDPAARFEDYILKDLTKTVAARYAVDLDRQAIAGFSMGGYGALVLGLRHATHAPVGRWRVLLICVLKSSLATRERPGPPGARSALANTTSGCATGQIRPMQEEVRRVKTYLGEFVGEKGRG
jgi:S-formylglutathione hydrolase FrmB